MPPLRSGQGDPSSVQYLDPGFSAFLSGSDSLQISDQSDPTNTGSVLRSLLLILDRFRLDYFDNHVILSFSVPRLVCPLSGGGGLCPFDPVDRFGFCVEHVYVSPTFPNHQHAPIIGVSATFPASGCSWVIDVAFDKFACFHFVLGGFFLYSTVS